MNPEKSLYPCYIWNNISMNNVYNQIYLDRTKIDKMSPNTSQKSMNIFEKCTHMNEN